MYWLLLIRLPDQNLGCWGHHLEDKKINLPVVATTCVFLISVSQNYLKGLGWLHTLAVA